MNKAVFFVLVLSLFFNKNRLFAQEKFEKESRLKEKQVPAKALNFLDSLQISRKIKWFKEEGLTRESIEAKFKHNKANYSIEFDIQGKIEDIEKEIDWAKLDNKLRDSISHQLSADCTKFKISKVQIQYTGSECELYSVMLAKEINKNVMAHYELIVQCKHHNTVELFEYLFSDQGKHVSHSIILFKNSSHLEY